jgi:hypothetical protein
MADVGRKRIIKSPEEFAARAEAYFRSRVEEREPVLLTGLMLALGIHSKETWREYCNRPEYREVTGWARQMIEASYESLVARLGNSSGPQFALRANFGWSDQRDVRLKGDKDNPIEVSHRLDIKTAIRELIIEEASRDDAGDDNEDDDA